MQDFVVVVVVVVIIIIIIIMLYFFIFIFHWNELVRSPPVLGHGSMVFNWLNLTRCSAIL